MKHKQFLLIVGFFAFVSVLATLVVIVRNSHSFNGQDVSTTSQSNSETNTKLKDKKRLRKITIEEANECLEVTADGVVRSYDRCGGTLVDANRLFDPKRIVELFEYTSRIDPTDYRQKPEGSYVRLLIESESGTQIVYIPVRSGPDSITDVITYIKGDLPQPTATPGPTLIPTPTLPGTTIIPTITPTPTIPFGITPTSTPPVTPRPFTCGFAEDPSDKRPYNVTNVICSTEPSPGP